MRKRFVTLSRRSNKIPMLDARNTTSGEPASQRHKNLTPSPGCLPALGAGEHGQLLRNAGEIPCIALVCLLMASANHCR